jgi:hypothetical protein
LVLDLALRYADNTAIVTDLAEMLRKYETRMICPPMAASSPNRANFLP